VIGGAEACQFFYRLHLTGSVSAVKPDLNYS
jgi:hypothetical protein